MLHQEMISELASSSSKLKAAVPAKRAREEEELQTNQTMEGLNEMRHQLDRVRETLARVEEDRDMWRRLFDGETRSRENR